MRHLQFILTLCVMLLLSSFLAQNVNAAASCCDVPGDANASGSANVDDAVYLINLIFKDGPSPDCWEEGDANGDGNVNVGDVVFLIRYVFTGGPVPVCRSLSPVVFTDSYGPGVSYEAFAGSLLGAVQIDSDSMYTGTRGLRITIPGSDPWWSGGAFTDYLERDLSGYNCLTFWAKASQNATVDVAGIGNDNTGTSLYMAEVANLALTTDWQQYIIPIPLPEKLHAERGLFYFAEGEGVEYQIYIDHIIFDNLGTITNPRPALNSQTIDAIIGATVEVGNGMVTFDVGGTDMVISAMPGYFTFNSSDPSVVSVGGDGVITAVGEGTAALTAYLGAVPATGEITVNVSSPQPVPTIPAPTPTVHPDSVVSLFSDAYVNHPVDTWSAVWDMADVEDYVIGSDNTKKYTNLVFAGIEFTTTTVDASAMTNFHMDVWTPDPTGAPAVFNVKLVDFGGDGAYGGGDDTEFELVFDETTMSSETWVSIDVPLSSFSGMATGHLAQMIISGDPNTVYVDNIYFYDAGLPAEPTVPAPTPTVPADSVVALYSDAYTSHPVDTWSADWDQADVEDFVIGSDNTKKYTNLVFAGIEFASTTLDASSMTRFHMDVWTPDATAAPSNFRVKLVDFGADGAWGGGDDVEHELIFDETTMNTGEWVGIDIPLSDFTNLTTTGHLAQMIIASDYLGTVFVDNIYFYVTAPTEPTTPAPTPTVHSDSVVALYSDAYTSHPVDTWSADWDMADVEDFVIGSDNTKKYTNLVFAGIEFASTTLDASAMTRFHMDVWTPDATAAPSNFRVKLVDFGADGVWGGDDVEHELIFDETTMNTGEWVGIDIPLSDFANLTTTGHLAQMIIASDYLGTVFVDNIYFYVTAPTEPTTPAPTPMVPADSVVALYSDAYTSHPVDTWSADWDMADVEDFMIGSDNTKKYTNLVFAGIEFTSTTLDASAMTRFHMDVWTPDATANPSVFKVKLVDFGADGVWGGDDVEHELIFDETTMNTGEWVGIDIPLSDFTNLTTTGHLAQMIISGDPNTVFVDNVYFYVTAPTEPTSPAPTPTYGAANVVSLYSDAYTNHPVDTWSADWDMADVADEVIGSDNVKLYTNLSYAGIEFTSTTLDASAMTRFHIDVWTPDATANPSVFNVKLVDFGADGVWGGDDVEHELIFDETTMNTGSWVSIDVPLSDFTNLTTTGHLAQLIISGDPNTVFVDNIYFYNDSPMAPAPTPTHDADSVISLFSDAYTDHPVDTWSAGWDMADVADVVIGSDNAKLYTNLSYAGIEFTTTTVDASTMTYFHLDLWTPDATSAPSVFNVKLVDFGADGAWGGGDDVEHELTFGESTLTTGDWVSLDIQLSDFTNLITTGHLAQLIISGDPNTVYVDNVYFHK